MACLSSSAQDSISGFPLWSLYDTIPYVLGTASLGFMMDFLRSEHGVDEWETLLQRWGKFLLVER